MKNMQAAGVSAFDLTFLTVYALFQGFKIEHYVCVSDTNIELLQSKFFWVIFGTFASFEAKLTQ
jgi:hypothetical protein